MDGLAHAPHRVPAEILALEATFDEPPGGAGHHDRPRRCIVLDAGGDVGGAADHRQRVDQRPDPLRADNDHPGMHARPDVELDALLGAAPGAVERADRGYFRIVAEAGLGKSALAAELVKRFGAPCYFLDASAGRTGHQAALNALCAQLIVRYGLAHTYLPADAGTSSERVTSRSFTKPPGSIWFSWRS